MMKALQTLSLTLALTTSLLAQLPADYSRPEQNAPTPQATPPAQAAPAEGTIPGQTAPTYTPKYRSDPAHSESEFAALAYVRGVMRAQMLFHKAHAHYASTLSQLVHTGNFTQRWVNPDRGDYTASFKTKKESYILTMTPKVMDPQHRSFYAEDDGKIHADESKPADADSPVIETHRW